MAAAAAAPAAAPAVPAAAVVFPVWKPAGAAPSAAAQAEADRAADVIAVSERLRVRRFRAATDAIAQMVLGVLSDARVVAVFPPSWANITSEAAALQWYADRLTDDGPTFVVERRADGACVGFFGALPVEHAWLHGARQKAADERKAKRAADASPAQSEPSSAGAAQAGVDHSRLELGYMFAFGEWGKGYATEATTAVLRQYVFGTYRGGADGKTQCAEAFGWTDPKHAPSIAVLRKAGLKDDDQYTHSAKAVLSLTRTAFQLTAAAKPAAGNKANA